MNNFRKLRKSNNTLEKRLYKENRDLLTDITLYLRYTDIYDEQIEEIRQDILYMILDAQEQEEPIEERIGKSYKAFCDNIIENTPKKTCFEKIVDVIQILAIDFLMFLITIVIVEIDFSQSFQSFKLPNEIYVTFFSCAYFTLIILLPAMIRRYITKTSLLDIKRADSNSREKKKLKMAFISGITVAIFVFIIHFFKHIIYFYITIELCALIFILCIILLFVSYCTNTYLHHKHIQMTKTRSN